MKSEQEKLRDLDEIFASLKVCLMIYESPGLVRRNKIEIMKEILK